MRRGPAILILGCIYATTYQTECLRWSSLCRFEHSSVVCLSLRGQTGTVKDQTLMSGQLTWFDNVTGLGIEVEPQAGSFSIQRPLSLSRRFHGIWASISYTMLYNSCSYTSLPGLAARQQQKGYFSLLTQVILCAVTIKPADLNFLSERWDFEITGLSPLWLS